MLRLREQWVAAVAQCLPPLVGAGRLDQFAAQALARGAHRRLRTRQAHPGLSLAPGGRRQRQRLRRPLVEGRDCGRRGQLEAQGRLAARPRQHLERHLGDDAEDAERAAQQARHVEAGDILHHLAAEAQPLAAAGEKARAQHEVARRASVHAPRAGQAGGDHPAERGIAAEGRRLEGQELVTLGERAFELGQWRAAARRDDQFRGLVVDDAAPGSELEHLALERLAVEVLAARAPQAQRAAHLGGGAHALGKVCEDGFVGAGGHRALRSAAARDGRAGRDARACVRTRRSAPASG